MPTYENFKEYVEEDPGDDVTVTPTAITGVSVGTNYPQTAVSKDFGEGFLAGNFEFQVECTPWVGGVYHASLAPFMLSHTNTPWGAQWAADFYWVALMSPLVAMWRMYEFDDNVLSYDSWTGIVNGVNYFLTFERDMDVGTYGTLYVYIRTVSHEGPLSDTLVITLSSDQSWRWVRLMHNKPSGNANASMIVANLDMNLPDPDAPVARSRWPKVSLAIGGGRSGR